MSEVLPVLPDLRLDLRAPDVSPGVDIAALLSDRNRASILRLLADGPVCVCELAAALDERQNNVSNHLARLRDAGLVRRSRGDGDSRRIYYERDEDGIARARAALDDVLQ